MKKKKAFNSSRIIFARELQQSIKKKRDIDENDD